jgi:YidC/Oxa1 family membrane protein insertase
MDDQNKNLILAFALSLMVILIWFALFPPPEPEPAPTVDQTELVPPPATGEAVPSEVELAEEAAPTAERVGIDTPNLTGSISLMGGRIDDLQLRDYRETTAPGSDIVHLFNPVGSARDTFYALYGWSPARRRRVRAGSGAEHRLGTGRRQHACPRRAGDAALGQRRGAGLHPHDRGRSRLHVHRHPDGREQHRRSGLARSLRDPRPARAALGSGGVLHLARGPVQMADGTLTEDSYRNMRNYSVDERERTPARSPGSRRTAGSG